MNDFVVDFMIYVTEDKILTQTLTIPQKDIEGVAPAWTMNRYEKEYMVPLEALHIPMCNFSEICLPEDRAEGVLVTGGDIHKESDAMYRLLCLDQPKLEVSTCQKLPAFCRNYKTNMQHHVACQVKYVLPRYMVVVYNQITYFLPRVISTFYWRPLRNVSDLVPGKYYTLSLSKKLRPVEFLSYNVAFCNIEHIWNTHLYFRIVKPPTSLRKEENDEKKDEAQLSTEKLRLTYKLNDHIDVEILPWNVWAPDTTQVSASHIN